MIGNVQDPTKWAASSPPLFGAPVAIERKHRRATSKTNKLHRTMSACKKARVESSMSTAKRTGEATFVVTSDRLSSLFPNIKGNVMSRSNAREAVRTSTLSSTWRDAWTNMPKISLRDRNFMGTRFITLADMLLALHMGTITEFDISGSKSYQDEFARWMLMMSRRLPRDIQSLFSFCTTLPDLVLTSFEGINHSSLKCEQN
uniref:Uncharacterized protein n=1 Tax=Aegilops tauschii TaxID=37682 RepID=R7W826_AEGTA